ncbi:unnamed protein product [Rhizoctonia solani]|uniref:Uncharacterized protein n=1 Tax=Rhizoctonia solani TaxID=456999 RepID=A0A8H3D9R6_9AGAM|nr:unnamed protein product [Rhizoctonia solani]
MVDVESFEDPSELLSVQLHLEETQEDAQQDDDPDVDIISISGQSDIELLRSPSQGTSARIKRSSADVRLDTIQTHASTMKSGPHSSPTTPNVPTVGSGLLPPGSSLPSYRHSKSSASSTTVPSLPLLPENDLLQFSNIPGSPSRIMHPTSRSTFLEVLRHAWDEFVSPTIILDYGHPESSHSEIQRGDFLTGSTISAVLFYLVAERLWIIPSETVEFAVCIPDALPSAFRDGWHNNEVHPFATIGPKNPKTILVPVVDRVAVHSYLWYIRSQIEGQTALLDFKLIDSLGGKEPTTLEMRGSSLLPILQQLFPAHRLLPEYTEWYIPSFQQQPGSNECGFHLCQALSACLFDQMEQLEHPISIHEVQTTLARIFQELAKYGLTCQSNPGSSVSLICPHRLTHFPDSSSLE